MQYLLKNNWTPCVEFEASATAYAKSGMLEGMDSSASSGYYVNRYWSMWKLPMYGATDADSVVAECKKAAKAFPNAFIRLVGFDAVRQARCVLRSLRNACARACAAAASRPTLFGVSQGVSQKTWLTRPTPPRLPRFRPTGADGWFRCEPPVRLRRRAGRQRPRRPGLSGSLAAAALPHARGAHTRPGRAARASTP